MNNNIQKFSTIIKNAINEAFDFNDDAVSTGIKSTILDLNQEITFIPVRNKNCEIPLKDIFMGLYKIKTPFKRIKSIANIDKIGKIWYASDIWDPDSHQVIKSQKSYDKDIAFENPINFEKLFNVGWHLYITKNARDWGEHHLFSKSNLYNIHPKICDILTTLLKTLGEKNLKINWNSLNEENQIMTSFAISPDNGIIVLNYLILYKEEYVDVGPWVFHRIKPNAVCYMSNVIYTGLVQYEIDEDEKQSNQDEYNQTSRKINFIKNIAREIGIALPWFSAYNYGDKYGWADDLIKADNGDYILPLGSTIHPFGSAYWVISQKTPLKILPTHKIKTSLPTLNVKPDWLSKGLSQLTGGDTAWTVLFNNSKLVVWQSVRNKHVRMFMSTDIDIIKKLIGDEAAKDIEKRPIVLDRVGSKSYTNNREYTIVYKFLWFDEPIQEMWKNTLNGKKYSRENIRDSRKK